MGRWLVFVMLVACEDHEVFVEVSNDGIGGRIRKDAAGYAITR